MPQRPKDDLVRLNLGSHDINGRFRRCRPAVKNCRKVNQQKGKGVTFMPPKLSSTLKKPWGPPELSTLLMPWERELSERSLVSNRSSSFHYQSNPISEMLKEANGHLKRMLPPSPVPTSPLPFDIFNPETPRKTRLESHQSRFLDIRVNLFKDDEEDDVPFRPIATTPITPITPIITTNLAFSPPVQQQEYYAPWNFTTPGSTPIITTDFSFSPNPQVHSPQKAFVTSTPSTTTTAAPITPTTPSAPITPMITLTTTDNDEEQISTVASTSADKKTDKKIGKERKEPLRRSARIAAIKIKPNYKD